MSQSIKAILQLIVLIASIVAICVWTMSRHPDNIVWLLRLSSPLVAILLTWLLIRTGLRKEILPDLLSQLTPRYFERDGLCFAFSTALSNGICWVLVHFQNRYEKACRSRIVLLAPGKSFSLKRHPLPGIDVELDCDGGAFGVIRIPWGIPLKLQGKKFSCDVKAQTKYPNGPGKLLRFREGLRVRTPNSEVSRAAMTLGLAALGVIRISRSAFCKISLPVNVAEVLPGGVQMVQEILWRPELSTGGFPVSTAVRTGITESSSE